MSICVATAELNAHLAEVERADAIDDYVDDVVKQHTPDMTERLLTRSKWLQFATADTEDFAATIAQALAVALVGDEAEAGRMLAKECREFAAREADRLLRKEAEAQIDRDSRAAISIDVDQVRLPEWMT